MAKVLLILPERSLPRLHPNWPVLPRNPHWPTQRELRRMDFLDPGEIRELAAGIFLYQPTMEHAWQNADQCRLLSFVRAPVTKP